MAGVDDPIIDETPPVMLPEEPELGDEEEEQEQDESLSDRAKDAYDRIKEERRRAQQQPESPKPEGRAPEGKPEPAKPVEPAPEVPKAGAEPSAKPAPSDVKGKVGRPITPKGVPRGAGAVGETGEGLAEGANVAKGAAGAAKGVGTAARGAEAAKTVASGAKVAAAGWEIILIIIIILLVVAFILFIVGFVVGLASGGQGGGGGGGAAQYGGGAPYISTDGKYFPLVIRPQNNFTPGSSRGFGDSRSGGRRHHAGVDLIAPPGTPIRAIADGTIVNHYAFYSGTDCLFVNHGDFVINYGEIGSVASGLSIGSHVSAGQIIAYVGQLNSGSSMLHMEMYTPGTTQNSAWYGSQPSNLLDPTSFVTNLLSGFK